MGEAKASGNLGNTLKVLGRFDEAIVCCQRHLDIAQEQGDRVGLQPLTGVPCSGLGLGPAGDPPCTAPGYPLQEEDGRRVPLGNFQLTPTPWG